MMNNAYEEIAQQSSVFDNGDCNIPAGESAEKARSLFRRGVTEATVAAAVASLIFEQSPANEALRVNIGLDILQSTQSAPAVGLAVAAVTAGIEMTSSSLISLGLHSDSSSVQKLKNRFDKSDGSTNKNDVDSLQDKSATLEYIADKTTNLGIALGIGAGLVTVKEHMKDESPTLSKDLRTSAKASGVVATVSGGIGYLAAGGISSVKGTALEVPAELFVDWGTDTRFWVGALAVGYGAYYAKKGIESMRKPNNNASNIEAFLISRGLDTDGKPLVESCPLGSELVTSTKQTTQEVA